MFRPLALLALVSLGTALTGMVPWGAAPGPGERGAEPLSSVPACLKVTTSAPFRGIGYDHVVTLQSSCSATADCSVKTDVNPTASEVVVPPSQSVDVVTWRGSPAYEFHADVTCKLRP
jgi:hypothetical protein